MYQAWLNPVSMFVCLFLFAFFVLFAVDYIDTNLLDTKLYCVYFLSFSAYIFGALVDYRKKRKIKLIRYADTDNEKKYALELRWLFYVVAVFTLLHWYSSIAKYGLIGLFSSLMVTKFEDMETNNIFIQFSMISMFLSPYTLFYILKYRKWKSVYTLILIFTFLANLSYSRATLFWIFFLDMFVVIYYYQFQKNKKSVYKLLVLLGVATVLFISYFSSTQELLGKASDSSTAKFLGLPMSPGLTTMVSYFAGPLVSPYHYLRMNVQIPDLGFTLRFIYDHLSPFGISIDTASYMPEEFVPIPFAFNTTAIHYYILAEGGWLWVLIFFFFLGYIVDKAFWSFFRKGDRFTLMWLCFLSLLIFMSLRSYLFTFLCSIMYLGVLFIIKYINRVRL